MEKAGKLPSFELNQPVHRKYVAEIGKLNPNVFGIQAMLKDLHLLETAVHSNKIVVSDDRIAAKNFNLVAELIDGIDELRSIMWVNPVLDDDLATWLEKGAPEEKARMLGYRKPETKKPAPRRK